MQHHTPISKETELMISQEAYELVKDPTRLLSLLYSKYGDIDEDYNYMYLNPIVYSKSSHILSLYKEYQYMDNSDEYLKRFYAQYESEDRLPRLSEYYKNYHIFFCRPVFRNWILTQIMHSYGDNQAEIFYKNNYANNDSDKHTSQKHNQSEDESLSSLDNITNNKTIFDKKIRCIIENNKQSNCTNTNRATGTTLTLDITKGNYGLISKRSKNNSFVNLISGMFVAPKTQQQQQNIKVNTATPNSNNNNNHCYHNGGHKIKSMRMKSSLCTLTKAKIESFPANCSNFPINGNGGANNNNQHNNAVNNNNNNKILLSPKLKPYLTTFKSNFAEFNKNKPKYNYNNYNHYNSIPIKNKTSYNNNHGGSGNHNHIHNNTNHPNHPNKFSKLSTSNTKNSLIATMAMPPNGASLNSNTISINGNPSCTNRRVHSNISSTINSGISSTLNSAIHNNNPCTHQRINSAFQAKKNKTYDIQYNNTNHNTRLHKPTKTKYKTSSLSKISPNPVKTPLSKTTSSSNNTILHPSSSIPRYSSNSKQCSSTKNSIHVKHTTKDIDSLSYSNLITNQKRNVVQSQRCSKNKNGINVKSPTMLMTQRKKVANTNNSGNTSNSNFNSINNNMIYSHGKGIFNSRNKKTLQKNIVQTIRSSKCKNTTNTNNTNTNHHYTNGGGGKSVDDKKDKQCGGTNVRKLLSELTAGKSGNLNHNNKQDKKYEMSDKLINQIEELIKKAKFGNNSNSATVIVRKSSHGGGGNNNNNKNCYVNHHQHSKSNGINECNSNMGNNLDMQCGLSTRGNSMKPINVNLNTNLRMKSTERKSNVRILSPKI